MNSLARFACYRVSLSLRFRQGYRVFPIVSSYLIVPQLRIVTGIKMQSRERANGSDEQEERGDSGKRITRSEVGKKEKEKRDFYLQMSLEEKRKLYKCKKRYKTLGDIPTWDMYYHENKANLLKKLGKKKTKPLCQVNAEINRKVSIWKGDITTLEIDAIVNAANSSLLGGGGGFNNIFQDKIGYTWQPVLMVEEEPGKPGKEPPTHEKLLASFLTLAESETQTYADRVDGAIHEAAGRKLYEECVTLHGCNTGEAKITGGYKLPAKYVIHAVGPIGEKELLLTKAYENCLKIMMENKLRSLALPCISTGIYGYDNEKACHVALKVVQKFLTENADSVDRVIFCLFLAKDVDLYEENMQIYFPVETVKTSKLEASSGSSEENANTDPNEKSQEVKQKETGRAGKKAKILDKEGNSSDVEMEELEPISKIETKGDSPEKENIKASESEGKEKTSSDTDKEKSTETIKSKTHDKDSFQAKENTESLKEKDKEVTSSDVEMKETESTIKSKLNIKGGSKSEGHDMETESDNKSSEDAQAILGRTNVSKNESGDKDTDGKQFGKYDRVHTSRM